MFLLSFVLRPRQTISMATVVNVGLEPFTIVAGLLLVVIIHVRACAPAVSVAYWCMRACVYVHVGTGLAIDKYCVCVCS